MVAAGRAILAGNPGQAISLREVSHGYDLDRGHVAVLDRLTLEVKPGEFVAILGASGCGKSTLLRLIAGLERPRAGQILVDGEPVAKPDPSRILVFQDPTLYPWRSVRKNVALGLEARRLLPAQWQRVDDTISLVRLEAFASAYPHQLSGGMAQRAALARALVNDPRVLLLDEPLGKLDALTRMTMQGEIEALWQRAGFTALLVTHDIEEALLLASRIILLSDRPAHIVRKVAIDRPYPRRRDDPSLSALRQEILATLGVGAVAQDAGIIGKAEGS
ncbi:ABC transporter ATP-binding protein [Hypericibacter adhaerens]|uniref:ABC transporter ATP-binding protein n=1 Tax=Hypericibacter adhaerens TaxID=2602016 RepID=UPI001CD9AD6F|nr:ABC transporter ATP-binding protein [Hypericibacter adhaerens]